MSQVRYYHRFENESIFQDYSYIIPNEGKDTFFDVEEIEIYKILLK
jgi:hypothetical protein